MFKIILLVSQVLWALIGRQMFFDMMLKILGKFILSAWRVCKDWSFLLEGQVQVDGGQDSRVLQYDSPVRADKQRVKVAYWVTLWNLHNAKFGAVLL